MRNSIGVFIFWAVYIAALYILRTTWDVMVKLSCGDFWGMPIVIGVLLTLWFLSERYNEPLREAREQPPRPASQLDSEALRLPRPRRVYIPLVDDSDSLVELGPGRRGLRIGPIF